MRICRKCCVEKDESLYYKNKKIKDGIDVFCADCRSEYRRNYNSKKRKIRPWETWKENHRVCHSCKNELPFSEFHKAKNGLYGLKGRCKSCEQKRNNSYRRKNNWENNYRKRRRSTDIQFKLRDNLRNRFNDALRRHTSGGKVNKKHSAFILLGCDIFQFTSYIEKLFKEEMSWSNYGSYWEIDHIIPCAAFDLTDPEHQKKCFHYTNLQPLTIHENRSKRDKIIKIF